MRPPRRPVGSSLLAFGLIAALAGCSGPDGHSRPESRAGSQPSLLVVTLDTTRPDRLAPYGGSKETTPTLAALAREGVVFERAYSVAPITLPAHTSMFTGLYPPQHGVRNNGVDFAGPDLVTLAESARAHGYHTGAFVAAAVLDSKYGLDQGFEVYDDGLGAGRRRDRWGIHERPAGQVVDSATRWLASLPAGEPFFAWVHFFDAHAPWEPPSPFRERFAGRLYDGEIAYQDAELGRLLESPRIDDGVILTVIGDHGEALGEHGESTHGVLVYDSTLRIPWLLSGPGVPRGERIQAPASQVDLVPTLAGLLSLTGESTLPGRDLLRAGETPASLYAESRQPLAAYGWSPLQAMVKGPWKMIRGVRTELYDVTEDPGERVDLADAQPAVVRELARSLAAYGSTESRGRPAEEESLAALRSLGYLATGRATPLEGADLRDPATSIALHERILELFGNSDTATAHLIPAIREVLEQDPTNLTALQELPRALLDAGRFDEVHDAVVSAIEAGADPAPLWLHLARAERRQDRPEAALALLDRALEQDPRLFPLWIEKIHLQLSEGDTRGAQATVEAARELHAGKPWLEIQVARWIELPQGRIAEAEHRLRNVLADSPGEIEAYAVLADLLVGNGRIQEASTLLRRGVELGPETATLHSRLGLLLASGTELEDARRHLTRALELSTEPRPDLQAALERVIGRHAASQGRIAVLPAAAETPRTRLDDLEEALEQQLDASPEDLDLLFQLAALSVERGDPEGAEAHLRRALEIEPRQPDIWNDLGVMVEQQNRLDDARAYYQRALEFEPDMLQAMINLGILARRQGRYEEAVSHFERALRQPAAPIDVELELGNLYGGPLGRSAVARTHYEAFLLAAPSDPRAAQVRQRIRELEAGAAD